MMRLWHKLSDYDCRSSHNAHGLPVAEAAGRLGVHESRVRRRARWLNGQTAEVA